MPKAPDKPDLTEHEEEAVPFDDVLRKLLAAKPAPRKAPDPQPQSRRRTSPVDQGTIGEQAYEGKRFFLAPSLWR